MQSPNYIAIFQEVDAERTAAKREVLTPEQRRDIARDVADTLTAINDPATHSSLRDAHRSLDETQINAGIKTYAHEVADGKKFGGKDDPRLMNLLTVAPESKVPPAAPPAESTLSHLLEDRKNLLIFKDIVNKRADKPGTGQKAALWLQKELQTDKGTKELVTLFKKMEVLDKTESTTMPSQFAETHQGIKGFLKLLSRTQKGNLYNEAMRDPSPITLKRVLIAPSEPRTMTRRMFGQTLVAGAAIVATNRAHASYTDQLEKAMGATPKEGEFLPEGREDLYFGGNTTEIAARPENQKKIADAAYTKGISYVAAATATAATADVAIQGVRRALVAMQPKKFREQTSDILERMDTLVTEAEAAIARGTSEKPRPGRA